MSETLQQAARRLAAGAIREGFKPEALHEYTDPDGKPLHWRIRLKNPDTGDKWIRPMKLNGAGYTLGEPEYPEGKPLYRLRDLATRPDDAVIVCEGEWCADALAKAGALATTSGAADSAGKTDWRPLAGRTVTIWPDNDEAGQRYADAVADALRTHGCAVRVIDVAALSMEPKADAVDWLAANPAATAADVLALACAELPWRDVPGARGPSTAGFDAGTAWPEPKPIQAALHPVPVFDPDTLLPEALRGWIMDEADRMPCPPDFIAAGALVALGAIIGARCTIKPKSRDSWLIVPNLWGGIVGLPSAKKSPAIGAALKPLDRLIARAMEAHRADVEAFDADKTVFEAKKEAIEHRIKAAAKDAKKGDLDSIARELQGHRQQAPGAPVLRRYKSNDTTVEKLGELLRENPSGLLVMRDELVGLIASWDREGREGERTFYLEAWNGNTAFDTDRIGRGSIFIPNLCVSIFGGIQPDKLTGYLEQAANALANDGMLQRFQVLVYPDHRAWEWRDRSPAKEARDRAFAVFELLADFDPVAWGAAPVDDFAKFPYFRFDEAAQEIFIEWSGDLHRARLPAEDHPIIAQHLAKFDKLFPALALILHLTDCAASGQRGPVAAAAALRAAAWCDYLEAHARRCYGLLTDDGLRAAQALADKVRQGKLIDGFTARDVRRNQWRNLTSDEAVQAALDWLEDEGWLRADEVGGTGPGTGRRTWRYFINPKTAKAAKPKGDHDQLA